MAKKIQIPILKVNQWLNPWNAVQYDNDKRKENRKKPLPYFYLFTIKAKDLKKLSKVRPRLANEKRELEIGVQRKHDPVRSEEIKRYIKEGYPLSELLKGKKTAEDYKDLKMPGWLPTAIVANILKKETIRGQKKIDNKDLVIVDEENSCLILPDGVKDNKWNPTVPPIEIIDGQHRLWAFDTEDKVAGEFELPVVAFYDLDVTWQAYLFYTINVKPKKINRSLAYDLYPLLRIQEWLEKAPDTAFVYKETRAQEIVEVLWSYEGSPFKNRINMLGETQSQANITQAAFIRNLIASFIKTISTKGLGGLFGSKLNDDFNNPLSWNRTQQAAFIVYIWKKMSDAIEKSKLKWAEDLRNLDENIQLFNSDYDPAFYSKYSLISTDQGVRGFMHIINDMVFMNAAELNIRDIGWKYENEIKEDRIDSEDLYRAIKDLEKSSLNKFISELCSELTNFDWRTSSEPNLSTEERRAQMVFKGSSGYKELRSQLIQLLINSKNKKMSSVAKNIWGVLGYAG